MTIRVRPLPQEGLRVKQEFATALRDALGEQRAALLMQSGEPWMEEQFGGSGAEPTKIISVIRHPGGSCNISVKSGYSRMSVGGPEPKVRDHIPPHLRHLFGGFWHGNPSP